MGHKSYVAYWQEETPGTISLLSSVTWMSQSALPGSRKATTSFMRWHKPRRGCLSCVRSAIHHNLVMWYGTVFHELGFSCRTCSSYKYNIDICNMNLRAQENEFGMFRCNVLKYQLESKHANGSVFTKDLFEPLKCHPSQEWTQIILKICVSYTMDTGPILRIYKS